MTKYKCIIADVEQQKSKTSAFSCFGYGEICFGEKIKNNHVQRGMDMANW